MTESVFQWRRPACLFRSCQRHYFVLAYVKEPQISASLHSGSGHLFVNKIVEHRWSRCYDDKMVQ